MSDVFGAIADPTRRQILEALAKGAKTVTELVALTGEGQPTVSKHLKTLREAGLVSAAAEGQSRKYSLEPNGLSRAALWISQISPASASVAGQVAADVATELDAKLEQALGDAGTQVGSWLAAGATWFGGQLQEKLADAEVDARKLGRELGRQLADARASALDFAGEKEADLREGVSEIAARVTRTVKSVTRPADKKPAAKNNSGATVVTVVEDDEDL
jgi:DNA-binding transcriptional ArsR family regulator